MPRRFTDYLLITLKGIAMGAADVIPGVSGGTIALISGIYEELISSLSAINGSLLKTLQKEGFIAFWKRLNGNFLLSLFLGVGLSIITLMRLAKYLIEQHPVLIWAFFFGLIVASIYYIGKLITRWQLSTYVALIIGTAFTYFITTIPLLSSNNTPLWLLFLSGLIAICAMILPGISGAFILVILGTYKVLSDAVHDFDIKKIAVFLLGALIGLLSFSKVLKWLFKHYHNSLIAVLTGFILGSLDKLWPWKEVVLWHTNAEGITTPLTYQSISPFNYEGNPQIGLALTLFVLGVATILLLEKLGRKNSLSK